MRRRQSAKQAPTPVIRRCEGCGATASASALHCTICGRSFATADEVSKLWGPVDTLAGAEPPLLDLYARGGDELVFRAGGRAGEAEAEAPQAAGRRPVVGPKTDPWASGSGTLAVQPGRADSGTFVPPVTESTKGKRGRAARGERTAGARLRSLLSALLLLLVIGGAALWFGGRPYLSQQIVGNVGGAIDDELERLAVLPIDDTGRITLVERDITRSLRANADAYAPISDPRVALSRNGVRVTFTLYGVAHTLTGTLAVADGRVVLVDPLLDGPGSRLLDVDEAAAAAEESIADMFTRHDTRPVAVKTTDDTLTITTEPIG